MTTRMHRGAAPACLAALFAAAACTHEAPSLRGNAANDTGSVTIMTFNVENVFDTEDDPGKDDRTFLPLAMKQTAEHREACAQIEAEHWRRQCLEWDWNEEVLEHKLSVVAAAILQVGDGRGPDIVALQEVENIEVLERLRQDHLAEAGYRRSVLIEGRDQRGIDVAFLTRLELAEAPALHRIPFDEFDVERVADTRGILEATFRLPDGTLLTGYAVHFPAPYHPTAMRVAAYRYLNVLKSTLPEGRPAFAAGDFNTTSQEDREKDMLERFARPHWTVVHEQGCEGCRGTSYYPPDGSWSFLDMILWSPGQARGADATWRLAESSVRIANRTPVQVTAEGTPARFRMPGASGVSDHWPLVFSIESK